jgi:SAM-dependent methyltransferase
MADKRLTWEEAVRFCMTEPSMAALAKAAYFLPPLEAGERYWRSAEYAEIRLRLPEKAGRALDLGAGNGILSYALAKDGWAVTAVEPDPSLLIGAGAIRELAAALQDTMSGSITVIEAFGEAIPLEAAGFDLVVARQVLHHAADLPAFCREMSRLSRDGAVIMTLRDHVITGPDQLPAFLARHPLHKLYGGENAFTLAQYRDALAAAGLGVRHEWRSFQSVVNYDPYTPADLRGLVATRFGALRPVIAALLRLVPFAVLGRALTLVDRTPGRLVSFLAIKGN